METEYHHITGALEEAQAWLQDAYRHADNFAEECDGQYEGMNETARRLQALIEKFKADCTAALGPIQEAIEADEAHRATLPDEPMMY